MDIKHNFALEVAFVFNDFPHCECGCGSIPKKYGSKFLPGHFWKGKLHTNDTKLKISHAHLGIPNKHNGNAMRGKFHSVETKQKMSLAAKGRIFSIEHRMRIGNSRRGKFVSAKTRKKMSEARRRPEVRLKASIAAKGRPSPMKGKNLSEKTKELIRHARLRQIFPYKDTKIELDVQNELLRRNIQFQKHYPILGQPDIAFPDIKLAVFIDGCYWHSCPVCKMKNKHTDKTILKDKVVNETLETQQWTVLRFWEHEIKSNIIGVGNRIEDGLKHAVIIT